MTKKKTYTSVFLGILGLVFLYFMSTVVIPRALVTFTKAAPATKVSLENSYLIGGRILASADGIDKCTVNVFVLDANGKGVKGKLVRVLGMETELEAVSDNDGKASFGVVSSKEGQFALTATVDGIPLSKELKVTFRN